jgi:large subunit ribosomal protein L29
VAKLIEEIKGKPTADLNTLLETTREELFKMRFAATTEPIDHPHQIGEKRRKIARVKTVLRQRELEAKAKAAKAAPAPAPAAPAPAAPAGKKK